MSGIIEKMQADIDDLKRKVAELEDAKDPVITISTKPTWARYIEYGQIRKPTRVEIVERAKSDISGLQTSSYGRMLYQYDVFLCDVEFIVNKEKRTVVALLRHEFTGIRSRGIAKCAPDDCFNVHIGKAIALRRALGEEVPDEYLNAPAPEGVEVGDIVRTPNGEVFEVLKFREFEHEYDRIRRISDNQTFSIEALEQALVEDDSARY